MESDRNESARLREQLRESEGRAAALHESSMELAIALSSCFEVLARVQRGDFGARVGDDVLGSADELVASFGQALNKTIAEVGEHVDRIRDQQSTIRELSTPVLQIWEGVLVLPVIGVVDSQRAADIMERLLTEIVRRQARYVILDITGVEVVDTKTADHLLKVVKASQLVGASCSLTGLRPAVAQTLVELGLDLSDIVTHGSVMDGLRECLGRFAAASGAGTARARPA